MEKRNIKLQPLIFGIAFMVVIWLAIMLGCKAYTNNKVNSIINASLHETIKHRSFVVKSNLEKEYSTLNSIALELLRLDINLEEAERFFLDFAPKPKASQYWLKLNNAQPEQEPYKTKALQEANNGAPYKPLYTKSGGIAQLSLYVPITIAGQVEAVVGRTFEAHELSAILLPCLNLSEEINLILDADCAVVSASSMADEFLKSSYAKKGERLVLEELRSIKADSAPVSLFGSEYYLASSELEIEGFYLLSLSEAAKARKPYEFLSANFILFSFLSLAGYIAIIAYLAYFWRKQGRFMQAEKERLEWIEERYRIVASESDDVIFEISLKDMAFEANENFHKMFGYCLLRWDEAQIKDIIFPEDFETFSRMLNTVREEAGLMQDKLRIRRSDGTYIWCHVLVATLRDESGRPLRVLGKITDIDSQMQETEWLRQKAQQDSLTQLYNKQTTHNLIQRFLLREGKDGIHGLIIIDVDDLKHINDTQGHLSGDAVLVELAAKMRSLFRSTDIVGRIGGDEFLVFLKNVNSRSQLKLQAKSLIDAFTSEADGIEYSCSIGAALYPEDGETIDWLFKNADSALYNSKRAGKRRISLHGETQL